MELTFHHLPQCSKEFCWQTQNDYFCNMRIEAMIPICSESDAVTDTVDRALHRENVGTISCVPAIGKSIKY